MDGPFVCTGSARYFLGLLAEALGRDEEALQHFEHAVAINDRIGAVPWSVRSRYRLAGRLIAGCETSARGRDVLVAALSMAEHHHLSAMRQHLQDRLDQLP